MKKKIPYFVLALFFFAVPLLTKGGNPPVVKWTVKNPFEQKVVIENKGQYSIIGKVASKDILYGARQGGLYYYFTTNSIWIKRTVAVKRTEQEIEKLKDQAGKSESHSDEDDEKELEYKYVDEYHEISFTGTKTLAKLTTDDEVSWYYSFTINGKVPVKAHAFKKLIYQNLYPGIDMEFYFPEEKEGFEYSFVVHPGADVSQIKIQYPLNEAAQLTEGKNSVVQSSFGSFTDHAPVASQQDKLVNCSFSLNNSMVVFNVSDYDRTKNLVIDPWVTTPKFTGTNSAYDLDWDNAGNCYIYGGSPQWQLIKYNSSGAMLWSYTESFDTLYNGVSYGDFAVDHNSQSAYIIQGAGATAEDGNGNAEIQKLNSSGLLIKTWGGDPNFLELWRIAINSCTNQALVVGGGTSNPTYTGCYLDTTLTSETGINILNYQGCCDDMWGIVLDKGGNYAYLGSINGPNGNALLQVGIPSLSPVTWDVPDGYSFAEKCCSTFGYAYGVGWGHVGYNGMALSNNNLYTYDSHKLKQWNTLNGNLTNGKNINLSGLDSIDWGGLTSDQCGDVFLGMETDIQQYDGNMNLVNTIAAPDIIYDVKLGPNNTILYVCGQNFVEALQVSLPGCQLNVSTSITNATCTSRGKAIITSISGGQPPYTVAWNTTPVQTGDTAFNLKNGTYIATIKDVSCNAQLVAYDTITIVKIGADTVVVNTPPPVCSGSSATLIATGASTYNWYPSIGLSATSGDSVMANPTVTTTYFVVGTGSNVCPDTVSTVVTVDTLPVISVTPDTATLCPSQSISIIATGAKTYIWSPSTGLSATSGSSVTVSPLSTTSYTIIGIDGNGCENSTVLNIRIATLVVSSPHPICSGQSATLKASGMDNYEWYPATGLNSTTGDSVIAKPNSTITYTVTGSINNGCPNQALQVIVTVNPLPVIQVTPAVPSICFGQSITWSANGAVSYTWSPSTGLSSTTGNIVTLDPISTTTYSITGADSIGCSDTIKVVAYVDSLPSASFVVNPPSPCNSQQIQFINTSIGGSTYLWDFGDGTTDNSTNPLHNYSKAGVYTVKLIVTTANGCSDSTVATDSIKSINYGVHIANAFAPASMDEGNNIFKPEQILCSENSNYIFRIYSRWGELLYETNDPGQGWDGTYKGKMEPLDVYVYYIQYNCGPCTQFIKGNVTLLR